MKSVTKYSTKREVFIQMNYLVNLTDFIIIDFIIMIIII